MTQEKRGRGRPRLDPAERRDQYLRVRMRKDELATLEAAAENAGESVSDWARGVLLRSAKRASR